MLTENKFRKYLFYAIGEIILVIIGILIALTINNNNEIRKNENKYLNNLSQVRDELKINIENTKKGIFFYQRLDSLFGSVMSDTLGIKDYKTSEGYYLTNILFNSEQTVIFKSSFNNLNQNIENLPESYIAIFRNLDIVYSEHSLDLIKWNQIMRNETLENEAKIGREQKWFSSYLWTDEPNEKAINFFLNDPFYKNQVAHYYKNSREHLISIKTYRVAAIKSFLEITHLLEEQSEIKLDSLQYTINREELKCYVGKYQYGKGDTTEITLEGDKLFQLTIQGANTYKEELHPLSINKFFMIEDDLILEFVKATNCNPKFLNWKMLGGKYKFTEQEITKG